MKGQDDLIALVKSLSGSEKRYFKLYAKRNSVGGKSNYLLLFNLIERSKVISFKEVRNKLPKNNKGLNLAETKYLLQKLILKSLVAFYSESNQALRINHLKSRIIILNSKSLHGKSMELIEKLKTEAMQTGNFALVIDLVSIERESAFKLFSYRMLNHNLKKWYNEQQHATTLLQNLNEYLHLHSQLMHLFFHMGVVRNIKEQKKLDVIINLPYLTDKKNALTPWSLFWFHYAHKIYAWVCRDYAKLLLHCNAVLDLFEHHAALKQAQYIHYIQALEHKARVLVHLKCEADAGEAIALLNSKVSEHQKSLSLEEYVQWFNSKSETELWYYHVFAKYKDGLKFIAQLNKELSIINRRSSRQIEMPSPFCVACICFGVGDYKQTIKWLNKIIMIPLSEHRIDLQVFARMLKLVCLFELNDLTAMNSEWRSYHRFLSNKKWLYDYELILIKFLRKATGLNSKAKLQKLFTGLKKELMTVKHNQFEKVILEYFNFEAWLNSKLNKKTFEESVKDQLMTT